MCLQPRRAVVGVDVETELGQPGKIRLGHSAAQRDDEAVVAQQSRRPQSCTVACAGSIAGHIGGDMPDTGRIKQVLQRDSAWAQVGLVVADPNVVERLRTDDGDLDGSLRDTELVQSPCRSERGPQPGEPGPENENA